MRDFFRGYEIVIGSISCVFFKSCL